MLLKNVFWLFPLIGVVCGRSLTFVIDTTKSMNYELDIIKKGLTQFMEDVTSRKSIDEFVLVKFKDAALDLLLTNNKVEFETFVEDLSPEGGEECPENSLSAIKKALEKSQDNSLLYVMTDAYAKDTEKLNDIMELCKKTGSRVSIFLSGTCVHNGREEMSPEHLSIFKEITKKCSGKLAVTNERGFKQAFKYEETDSEYTLREVVDIGRPKDEVEDISQETECGEEKPTTNDECSKEPFYFGMPFWPMSNRELPDCKPFVVSAQDVRIIQEITKKVFDEYNKCKKGTVKECPYKDPKYKTNPKPTDDTPCSPSPIPKLPVVEAEAPTAEINEPWDNQVEYGANITITCKITGVPQPDIKWIDNDKRKVYHQDARIQPSGPNTYYSYLQLKNITESKSYNCVGENLAGKTVATIAIEVKTKSRFEIINTPRDQTLEIYTEGRLRCEADVYPEPEITWYLNDTSIYLKDNIEIQESVLIIKNMTTDEVGNYTCEIRNEFENKKFNAFVNISGLEKPTVNIGVHEIKAKPGEQIQVNCSSTGKPVPEMRWSFKSKDAYDFGYLPTGIYDTAGKLYTNEVKLTHQGVYRCTGQNYVGDSYDDVTLSIGSPPFIENSDMENVIVVEKERVELKCNVHSDLPVKVKWETMTGHGAMNFNARKSTDDIYIHSFTAVWEDAGSYRCIAENDAGVTHKVINVDVYVAPYIKRINSTYIVKTGSKVILPCIVQIGNPAPHVYWEHEFKYKRIKILPSGSDNSLTLLDVHKSNQGIYTCTAKNDVGIDIIETKLKVC